MVYVCLCVELCAVRGRVCVCVYAMSENGGGCVCVHAYVLRRYVCYACVYVHGVLP